MTDQDRLAEIRQRLAAIDDGEQVIDSAAREFLNHAPADVNWLIYEVERLRGLLTETALEVQRLRAAHQAVWDAVPVVWDPADPHGLVFAKIATALVAAKMPERPSS